MLKISIFGCLFLLGLAVYAMPALFVTLFQYIANHEALKHPHANTQPLLITGATLVIGGLLVFHLTSANGTNSYTKYSTIAVCAGAALAIYAVAVAQTARRLVADRPLEGFTNVPGPASLGDRVERSMEGVYQGINTRVYSTDRNPDGKDSDKEIIYELTLANPRGLGLVISYGLANLPIMTLPERMESHPTIDTTLFRVYGTPVQAVSQLLSDIPGLQEFIAPDTNLSYIELKGQLLKARFFLKCFPSDSLLRSQLFWLAAIAKKADA